MSPDGANGSHQSIAPLPANETERIAALNHYAVLDAPPESAFEHITSLAAGLFDVPIALVSLVDRDGQWSKSCVGLDTRETPRDVAFCAHAILGDGALVVPDARRDPRFENDPLVTGVEGIRFCAGAPLSTSDGANVGTLCIADRRARDDFGEREAATLEGLAATVVDLLEMRLAEEMVRRKNRLLDLAQGVAVAANEAGDVCDALRVALDRVCGLTGWPVGHALLPVADRGDELGAADIWHLDESERYEPFRRATTAIAYPRGVGLPGRVLASGRPEWVTDLTQGLQPERSAAGVEAGLKTGLAFPVLAGDTVVGVLEFFSDLEVQPDEQFLEVMANVGKQLGTVVQRKRAVRERERFFTISLDLLAIAGTDGYFKELNPAWERVLGWSLEELKSKPFVDFVHPDEVEATIAETQKIGDGIDTISFENRYRCRDGSYRWLLWTATVDEMSQLIYSVARDVTERKAMEEMIRAAKEAAESADRAKSEFLSRISHELRTPLNAVLGFAQLFELEELSEDAGENIEQIIKGGRHLLDLINEVLDIARIETGELSLSIEPVAVGDVMTEVLELIKPIAARESVALVDELGEEAFHVLADRQRLKQVFLNLLSNAVKYNRRGGRVTVSCERTGDRLRIDITDTGYGMTPAQLERCFNPFERLGAEATSVEGTGLGLALSKRLTEAMLGTIGVESSEGQGSVFSVELVAVDPLVSAGSGWPEELGGLASAGSGTIIHIEDNPANTKLIEGIMARLPELDLITTMQGSLGLALAREHGPRLILLDLDLPDLPGDHVLNQLRSDPKTRDVPVIVLSADATPGRLERLVEAGAYACLTKPLDLHRFLAIVESALAREVA